MLDGNTLIKHKVSFCIILKECKSDINWQINFKKMKKLQKKLDPLKSPPRKGEVRSIKSLPKSKVPDMLCVFVARNHDLKY